MNSVFFYIPETLKQDFADFLQTEIDGSNYTCTVIPNWHEPEQQTTLRAGIHEISWKSKFTNTDNTFKFLVDRFQTIKKGDMVMVEGFDAPCILIWTVAGKPNCFATQIQKCNAEIAIERYQEAEIDSNGTYIKAAGWNIIIPPIPVTIAKSNNNYEYRLENAGVGILPSHKIQICLQANPVTLQVKINDEFKWAGERYVITDIFQSELDFTLSYGLLSVFAEKTNT